LLSLISFSAGLLGIDRLHAFALTLWASEELIGAPPRRASWYAKPQLTFRDALAAVRYRLWLPADFEISRKDQDRVEILRSLLSRLTQAACFPA